MRLWLAAVGRARVGPARDLFEEYAGRLSWPLTLREVEVKKRLPPDEMKRQEAELLLAAIPQGSVVVALDERGKALSSEAFAAKMGAWRDQGVADIAFLIGGADGHGDAVRARADLLLALGPMTWPHMLVRGMLTEQIYRAQQILAGHPYHRA
ncbi:23S rRNA (pseudouridine(1915)-N(3))-methyltransferase RlmH [Azospirillum soli]|uniref:23S rRNA (pseudouridine(1915)-N(3))-methyltransferase RlmH n=1 Tax=Azospirillum soli TaxID=1304799 RepID=UPI001AEB103D|nr:23S rRNA (pseudouridine(1915)-N(3))-methyltransferase RlmH [Azospirillum soli]MBP2315181.1 23S rRNA (pseudouridine1915-N3)-methyltransferase [Azospirillum soli]